MQGAMQASASSSSSPVFADGTDTARSAVMVDNTESEGEQGERRKLLQLRSGSDGSSPGSPLTSSTGCTSGPQNVQTQARHTEKEKEEVEDKEGEVAVASARHGIKPRATLQPRSTAAAAPILLINPSHTVSAAAAAAASTVDAHGDESRDATAPAQRVAPTLRLLPLSAPSPLVETAHSESAPPTKRLRLSLTVAATAAAASPTATAGPDGSPAVRVGGRERVLRLVPASTAAATPAGVVCSAVVQPSPPPPLPVVSATVAAVNDGLAIRTATANEEEKAVQADQTHRPTAGTASAVDAQRKKVEKEEEERQRLTGGGTSHTPTATVEAHTAGRDTTADTATVVPPLRSSAAATGGVGVFPRLRSLTPQPCAASTSTPTPTNTTNAQGSPRRRHRFVPVSLPSVPPPPQRELFNSFQRTVADVYEVQEKLSEGTYGEVFKGVDKRTGALVALKRLKTLSTHQGFPQTSLREVIALRHIQNQRERLEARQRQSTGSGSYGVGAAAAGAVAVADPLAEVAQLCDVLMYHRQHPDIVLVFAYASASLAGLLRRQLVFSPSELAYVMQKLLTAVRKLHAMSIIHRDIKSDNVLITGDGKVQLTDFGLCSIVGGGGGGASATAGRRAWRTPSVITLAYRPPEMLLGSTAYDEKVDVWSVGCLLAQFYLHEPPFCRHRAMQQQQQQPQRTAATELEQLARITEVLGPLPPARVYHPDACQHMQVLEELERQGRLAETGRAAQPPNWGKLQSLFDPSFLFQQFHGFRAWFEAEVGRSRQQPQLRPSQACVDVLCAALQLDPQQRPSAAELLRMPYFITLDDVPLLGTFYRPVAATPEREEEVRRGFLVKVQRCGDSHTQRRPH